MSVFTPRFGQAVWLKGHYGTGEWHYAPFNATQRHLACGKLTPTARDLRPLDKLPTEPICPLCLNSFKDDKKLRNKKFLRAAPSDATSLDGSADLGYLAREDGRYGSHPGYDAMDDDAKP